MKKTTAEVGQKLAQEKINAGKLARKRPEKIISLPQNIKRMQGVADSDYGKTCQNKVAVFHSLLPTDTAKRTRMGLGVVHK